MAVSRVYNISSSRLAGRRGRLELVVISDLYYNIATCIILIILVYNQVRTSSTYKIQETTISMLDSRSPGVKNQDTINTSIKIHSC
jgi:hypothetical protein